MLNSRKIRYSKNPAGALILFMPKKNNTLKLCVDYRGFNKVIVKNRYIFPFISELLNRILRVKMFSKLNLKDAYYKIRIKPNNK